MVQCTVKGPHNMSVLPTIRKTEHDTIIWLINTSSNSQTQLNLQTVNVECF